MLELENSLACGVHAGVPELGEMVVGAAYEEVRVDRVCRQRPEQRGEGEKGMMIMIEEKESKREGKEREG